MAEKKSEIKVISCGVAYDGDVPKFHNTKLSMKGMISKKLGDKVLANDNPEWFLVLDGMPVADFCIPGGASIQIKLANIRELPLEKFQAKLAELAGKEIRWDEVADFIDRESASPEKKLDQAEVAFEKLSPEKQLEYLARLQAKAQANIEAQAKAAKEQEPEEGPGPVE